MLAQSTGVDVRLVNVPVNPAGRFGAPETEPGPSGVASDVFMRIPFHRWHSLTIARRAAHRARVFPGAYPGQELN